MYIWKESIHGNRHADQVRAIGLDIQSALSKRVVFCGKVERKKIHFAVFSLNVFPSKTMRRPSWSCDQHHVINFSFPCT